ncbi:transposase [Porphyromonas macacae]|uniref:transposase n=1 Tax=Porphyromonas macacae TaxID=28115 RepID=UPI003D157AE9
MREIYISKHIRRHKPTATYCKARAYSKELVLKVPRTRDRFFYPSLPPIIRNEEDEEHNKLIFSLYSKGLTTEQVSSVFEDVYGKTYSKQWGSRNSFCLE